jgi:sulfur-oxidizing protein SoxA
MLRKFYLLISLCWGLSATAQPLQDAEQLKAYYKSLFPQLNLADYAQGVYALDPVAKQSWQAIDEFPPYIPSLEQGKILFHNPFKNGHQYGDCFAHDGLGIAQSYPQWDRQHKQVLTLSRAVNNCRLKNGLPTLDYEQGEITAILAYMAFTSRGKPIAVQVPLADPAALTAYQQGKNYYYQRRGQLNFSCATCHVDNAGKRLRAEILSPLLGHASGWPTYRLKWGDMGTLQRRIIGCHQQIRAKVDAPDSESLRNLEYFLTFMSNGVPITGPSTRK